MMRSLKIPSVLIIAVSLLLVLNVPGAVAQEREPTDDEVNTIARELYCPVCENVPLDVCPTQACEQWRATIREKLSEGWNEAQIKAYFVEQYGDRVLATPPAEGFNWLVYVLPPLAILVGVFILYRAIKSWRMEAELVGPTTPAVDDPYVEQFEEELRRRDL